ncbi:primosomal protein N' [Halalkalibacillus sediminis]|uniref:Replication restart protein PriA n=1 Tax=Halalkalibacillus sediminis TaxID=2018042 RepID=A0A2I0QW87_9BACI|nr:primosomal protein N' [Halalkalibacillus sediminis]PKR78569.1 primosomal protein N' [Halalkalibacillus sediminis]
MRIANVVIDVAASSIDSLFDYEIPSSLEDVVKPGVRVIVPFGPRKVMGFVVSLSDQSEISKLREVESVLDYTPIFTEELIHLSKWMQETTLCFRISAMQAMLPAVFKATYEKEVWMLAEDEEFPEEWKNVSQGREVFPFQEVEESSVSPHQVTKLVQEELIDIKYNVQRKDQVKTVTYVEPAVEEYVLQEHLEQLSGNARKQREVLAFMTEHYEAVELKKLQNELNITKSPIQKLVSEKLLRFTKKEIYRDPFKNHVIEQSYPLNLTKKQQTVIEPIIQNINNNQHEMFLLHGVTGSGKTEIYLQSIQRVLEKGQEAIVLVPEISLTPQMVHRFKSRFGDEVAVLHSGLSKGEKYDEWRKIHRNEVRVVVGARSAIFAPFENLGIIIIDEEHENTYKQEDYPKYHARDVAKFRGTYHKCPVVLGSATPTLETYARALKGVYHLLSLDERINEQELPSIDVVDMRLELQKGNRTMFSDLLVEKIQERLERKEQIVLLLNRRGYSSFVMCRECGETIHCDNCDISMTYHQKKNQLKCHYCNDVKPMPQRCPKCESDAIRFFGTGTQKVEEALLQQFEQARVIRMDVDTTSRKGSHEKLLNEFGRGEADILLGTQMIAKGLDFENVTLVGVIAADAILHLPDFRASEKTFQLLTQVSGRAGRHELPGEVVVQSYTPDHYSIELASQYDFESFFKKEMQLRKRFSYPPYYFLALINISHDNHVQVVETAQEIAGILAEKLSQESLLMGPTPSPMLRIKNRYRYQCMIKYKRREEVDQALREVLEKFKKEINQNKIQITIDFEPYHFM